MLAGNQIQDEVQQLQESIQTLKQRLDEQESLMRHWGVALPMGTLEKLNEIQDELEKITGRIQDHDVELGQLRVLTNTAALINSTLDIDGVLNGVMDEMIQLVGAERGYIMLRNRLTGELEPRVSRKLNPDEAEDEEMIVSRTIVERVLETGEAIVTTNAQEDDRFMGQESIVGYALRSIICVPLIFREKVLGALYCDNRVMDGLFQQREKRLLSAFANQAAIAIENAQLFAQIRIALDEITSFKILLDNILASIASGVITTDIERLITTYNESSSVILGRPAEQTYGQPIDATLPEVYQHIHDAWEEARNQNASHTVEAEVMVDQRGPLNLNLKVSPLKGAEDSTQGVAITVDDLTELKRRDATLAAVRRYLPPAVVDNIKSIDRLALGGERRFITILYAEVRPFDTLPSNLPPLQLMNLLNEYLTVGSEAIHHHSGLIDKFVGSEIMSLFNTQLNPREDNHAWDAVQAALRMAADFRTLARYGGLEDNTDQAYYRVGIHSGVATLGNVGSLDRREFSAIGDAVNLAHRLMENAYIGQIIISGKTLELCQPFIDDMEWIEVRELDPIQVKGRVQATRMFEIYDTETR